MSVGMLVYACAPSILIKATDDDGGVGGSDTVAASSSTTGQGAGPASSSSSASSSSGSGGQTCTPTVVEVEGLAGKVDLVLLAENGFNSTPLYDQLEIQLHPSMVAPMEQEGVDVQVIVVSDHGAQSQQLCFGPPLSTTNNCNGAPGSAPGKFHHYDVNLSFGQTLCQALSSLHGQLPDSWGQAPMGWYSWLRADAFKAMVAVAELNANCVYDGQQLNEFNNGAQQAALVFDQQLLAQGSAQFGTTANRHYSVSSLLSIQPKNGSQPHLPGDPIATLACSGFGNQIGGAYQWLSKGTEALRTSQCGSLPNALAAMASAIIEQSRNPCVWDVPMGLTDPTQMMVTHFPGGGQLPIDLQLVPTQACTGADDELYIDGDLMKLCPATCDAVTQSVDETIEVQFGCP
jgi:hypothetical protein